MSWFKDMVREDAEEVFLNEEEFAEKHRINGKKVICLVDSDISANSKLANLLGVYDNSVVIYVKEGVLPVPKVRSRLNLDGSLHQVIQTKIEDGMLIIVAEEFLS